MKVILIDDEDAARHLLRRFLGDIADLEIVAEASDGFEGFQLIQSLRPDAVFVDMQMPKLSGMEMIELLDSPPALVFATAYDHFAIQAFEKNAVDYLLKPFTQARVQACVQKLRQRIAQSPLSQSQLLQPELQRIPVKVKGKILVLQFDEITAIESDGDYVKIHTLSGTYLRECTLRELETRLPPQLFLRVHRSAILHLGKIAALSSLGSESWQAEMQNGQTFKVSAEGRKALRRALGI